MWLQRREIRFKVADLYFPDPATILQELHGEEVLRGRVIDSTESAAGGGAFLVLEVPGLTRSVIVPLARVEEAL